MEKENFKNGSLGNGFNSLELGELAVRKEMITTTSHSIIVLNLQTVDDVELVIRQCEALKGQMTDGSFTLKLGDNKIALTAKTIISESVNPFEGRLI